MCFTRRGRCSPATDVSAIFNGLSSHYIFSLNVVILLYTNLFCSPSNSSMMTLNCSYFNRMCSNMCYVESLPIHFILYHSRNSLCLVQFSRVYLIYSIWLFNLAIFFSNAESLHLFMLYCVFFLGSSVVFRLFNCEEDIYGTRVKKIVRTCCVTMTNVDDFDSCSLASGFDQYGSARALW